MIHEKAEVCNLVNCPFNGIRRMDKKKKHDIKCIE
jgi:hypothetical protein